ncbi:hypothetical protein CYMTET_56238 [Cymbomonas tetramitiformis]|uniref:ABC1 atypical kinase-like domain-containing protein n=1 Tax=Cymbomonas tetramitiformis TaxID=36881 RepID=A0AAE0BBP4_9CHLO|nr:hypothetical protein CYMTET_56238 [Cymbomonas tetramitiformis]
MQAGPTFVKLGQWASTRPDVFPRGLCEVFAELHSSVAPQPFTDTRHTIQEYFGGRRLEEVFAAVDEEPLGAGCIAQVHRVVFREEILDKPFGCGNQREAPSAGSHGNSPGATDWVIKVKRRWVEKAIHQDLQLMRFGAAVIHSALPISGVQWLALPDAVENFAKHMEAQLDLRVEGTNLERFCSNFKDGDGYGVEFPHVHPRLPASDSILVETEQDGQFVMDWMRGGNSTPEEHRAVALAGARSFFKMVLVDNLVHADLHPGNILIRYMPKEAQDARGGVRLVYLDAGLCTELGADDRRNFIDLFTAVALKDGELAGRLMLERSRHHQCSDPEAFVQAVAQTVAQVNCSQFTLAKVKIGSILNQILDLARVHHVLLESQFTGLIIGIMLLEGIGRQLYPDLDLFQVALPMLLNSRAEYQGAAAKIVFQAGFGNDKNSAT